MSPFVADIVDKGFSGVDTHAALASNSHDPKIVELRFTSFVLGEQISTVLRSTVSFGDFINKIGACLPCSSALVVLAKHLKPDIGSADTDDVI